MSADLLRRAAVKLREHAERIPPAENEEPWYRTQPPQYGFWRVLCEVAPDDAGFVALMSPTVGLALAEVLDLEVKHWDACRLGEMSAGVEPGTLTGAREEAVHALARAILREEES